MSNKAPIAYKTISKVSEVLDLPTHVIRFWEKKFKQISPYKNNGRRYYTPQDIDTIKNIKFLLYTKGFTITGVIAHLSDKSEHKKILSSNLTQILSTDTIATINNIIQTLKHVKSQLQEAIGE